MSGYTRQALSNIAPDLPILSEDINAELNAVETAFNATTGHSHGGGPGEGAPISLTASVTGILPIANGGTNATNASGARTNLGLGALAVLSTIENSLWSGTDLAVANGGTGASTAGDARTNLGLGALAVLSTIENSLWSGTDLAIEHGGTGASDASGARTNLGLGTLVTLSPTGTAGATTYLRGDNTWSTAVSSVSATVPTGFIISGSPITTSGTLGISYDTGYEGFTTTLKNSINSSVQTSGDQSIAGTKTFTGSIVADAGISMGTNDAISFAGTGAATTRDNLGLGDLAVLDTVNNDDWSGADLAIVNGGTGASDASGARTNLGAQLEPGLLGWFAANSPPTGWLKANGAAVSRTTYAALFAAIGTTFGVGDGSTTFDLPDLRGEFIRGWDDSRGVDSSRVFGSAQSDAFQGHMHDLLSETGAPDRYMNGSTASSSPVNFSTLNTADVSGTPGTYRLSVHNPNADGVNGTPRTAAETRPRNIAFLACIKY